MKLNPCPFRPPGQRVALLTALVIVLLGLPAVIGLLRSNEADIRRLENRNMAPRPTLQLWKKNAPAYIRAWEAWMGDNIGFRSRINAIYRKIRHESFQTPPQPNITPGLDGHVFLNSPDAELPHVFFDRLCVQQSNPPAKLLRELDATLTAASALFQRRGARVTWAIAPSSLALYPEKLPTNLPTRFRRACLAYPHKEHALARLQRMGAANGHYRVFYPYDLFAAHKDEPLFYPKERYHWAGRSVYLFTRHLLRASGALEELALGDPATPGPVEDDLAGFFGFSRPIEAYVYPYAGQPMSRMPVPWMRAFGDEDLLVHFATTGGLCDKTALLIANSFGGPLAPHLARGFRHLYALDTNHLLRQPNRTAVLAALLENVRAEYVYFVFDDVNLTELSEWLAGFVELEEQTAAERR